jgi:hypothetical protein
MIKTKLTKYEQILLQRVLQVAEQDVLCHEHVLSDTTASVSSVSLCGHRQLGLFPCPI